MAPSLKIWHKGMVNGVIPTAEDVERLKRKNSMAKERSESTSATETSTTETSTSEKSTTEKSTLSGEAGSWNENMAPREQRLIARDMPKPKVTLRLKDSKKPQRIARKKKARAKPRAKQRAVSSETATSTQKDLSPVPSRRSTRHKVKFAPAASPTLENSGKVPNYVWNFLEDMPQAASALAAMKYGFGPWCVPETFDFYWKKYDGNQFLDGDDTEVETDEAGGTVG